MRVGSAEGPDRCRHRPSTPDGRTPAQQIEDIRPGCPSSSSVSTRRSSTELVPALAAAGVELISLGRPQRRGRSRHSTSGTTSGSSRCSRRWRSIPAIRSRTSPTSRSRWRSTSPIPTPATVGSPASRSRNVFPRLVEVAVGRFLPGRAADRRQARHALRRHDRRGVGAVPGEPQRRPQRRRGRGRRPARSGRDGAAASSIQQGGAPRGRARHRRRAARAARARTRTDP